MNKFVFDTNYLLPDKIQSYSGHFHFPIAAEMSMSVSITDSGKCRLAHLPWKDSLYPNFQRLILRQNDRKTL